jgi:hypothetical protein
MTAREDVLARIEGAAPELKAGSDVDILVDFVAPVTLFEFARLRRRLESLLGRSVDLVTRDALKPQLREQILREACVPPS